MDIRQRWQRPTPSGWRAFSPLTLLRVSTQAGLLLVDIVLWVVFGLAAEGFLSSFNVFTLSRDIALFTAIFAGWLMQALGVPVLPAALLAILLGGSMGWFNGWLVVRTGISSFIVTLAMASVYTGLLLIITKAQAFSNLPAMFTEFGQASIGFLSLLVFLVLIIVGLLVVLYRNSELGRWMLAVGANRRAAQLSGIPVGWTLQTGHALSGLLAGLVGVLSAARLASALPSIGTDWVLPSFLAPVLGGTLLSGGVVSVAGTLLGGVLVESITNGLNLLQVNSFWVLFFQGIVLLLAVFIDRLRTVVAKREGVLA